MKFFKLSISDLITGLIGGIAALIFCSYAACAQVPKAPNTADGGTTVTTPTPATPEGKPCSLLDGIDSSGTLRTICIDIGEVAMAVQFILTLRATLLDGGANPRIGQQTECVALGNICATSAERSAAIVFISGIRDARLKRDGGVK